MLLEMPGRVLQPDVISCDVAINAGKKGAQWEAALELVEEIPRWALQPHVISYNAANTVFEKGV